VPGLSQPLVLAASKGGPEGTVQSLNDLMGKLELRGAGGATITTDDEEVITITTPDGTSLDRCARGRGRRQRWRGDRHT
jgi:hypothetical protein